MFQARLNELKKICRDLFLPDEGNRQREQAMSHQNMARDDAGLVNLETNCMTAW